MVKKVLIALLVIFIAIQFIPVDYTNPPVEEGKDFFAVNNSTPAETKTLIQNACYDCHSNETKYPFYSKIVPVSLWMKGHIEDGRKHLNFSDWGNYELERQQHKLEECVEMMENGEMPLPSYTLGHPEAKLSTEQRELLMEYFNGLK